jgi:hypothetical protein
MYLGISFLKENIKQFVQNCDELNESMIWQTHSSPLIWQANKFNGNPVFYPIYKYKDLYSYSLLSLIIYKGYLKPNVSVLELAKDPEFKRWAINDTIDIEISRIGSPHRSGNSIQDVKEYALKIVNALREDIANIESKNHNHTNVVLCGGKDSCNLLLLPWQNPVVAASADPNYPLVKEFVKSNQLNCEVIHLQDIEDKEEIKQEILENCCRANLEHWRWTKGLQNIAEKYDKRVIFWKGQVGDLYMAEKWKTLVYPPNPTEEFVRKIYKRTGFILPKNLKTNIGRQIQPRVIKATWERCANSQGAHLGFIRSLTNSLCLSAYHGPAMIAVLEEADLATVAQKDMRHYVGEYLLGKPVIYPQTNPAPDPSAFRAQLHQPEYFIRALQENGITIEN